MARKASDKTEADTPKKSGAVTVRLDPKLKYLADLAARKPRRPLSGFIEWAGEQSLARVILEEDEYCLNEKVTPNELDSARSICRKHLAN